MTKRYFEGSDGVDDAEEEFEFGKEWEGIPRETREILTSEYAEVRKIVGGRSEKLLKSVPTRFDALAICISRNMPKWC